MEICKLESKINGLQFLSHGTIPCSDLQYTIRFLTELFGFEHVQTSHNSASFKMGGNFCFSAIEVYDEPPSSIIADKCHHHFGIDVLNEEDVMNAYDSIRPLTENYGIRKITQPTHGHGTYFIYIVDQDSNYWEILVNPPNGYMYRFEDDLNSDTRNWRDQDNKNRDKQKAFLEKSEILGFVPNSHKTLNIKPELLDAYKSLMAAVMAETEDSITRALKYKLAQEVSIYSPYCSAHTKKMWDELEGKNLACSSEGYHAAVDFIRGYKTMDHMRKYFTDYQIAEIASVGALYKFLNTWNDCMETELEW